LTIYVNRIIWDKVYILKSPLDYCASDHFSGALGCSDLVR